MNDELSCSICVDTSWPREATAALVAELTGGVAADGDVSCPWARILVDEDYGDFEVRQRDPDDFLGWPTLLEILPSDQAEREEVVRNVTSLMNGLRRRGLRVLAKSNYAEELPGGGEVAHP